MTIQIRAHICGRASTGGETEGNVSGLGDEAVCESVQ